MLCRYCVDCELFDDGACRSPVECDRFEDCEHCTFDCPSYVDMYGAVTSEDAEALII